MPHTASWLYCTLVYAALATVPPDLPANLRALGLDSGRWSRWVHAYRAAFRDARIGIRDVHIGNPVTGHIHFRWQELVLYPPAHQGVSVVDQTVYDDLSLWAWGAHNQATLHKPAARQVILGRCAACLRGNARRRA